MMRLFKRAGCAAGVHEYDDGVGAGETGRLCFSLNCARPEMAIDFTCKNCGKIKREYFMNMLPWKALELTPEVAAKCLKDMRA